MVYLFAYLFGSIRENSYLNEDAMENTNLKKIVLPEGGDERVVAAAKKLMEAGVCHPVLIGDPLTLETQLGVEGGYTALSVDGSALRLLVEAAKALGKHFPVTDEALAQGAALVRDGEADGIVGGAEVTTSDVFRVYAKTIGVHDTVSRVTSCFLMEKADSRLIFADCGLNPESDAQQLAETAYLSAAFAQAVGIDPKVALLAFQTVGNAEHPAVQHVAEAASVARETYKLCVEGPMQFDAAFVPAVAEKKLQDASVAGDATVFIFPDLHSGNIAYKIAERMGGYKATGPLFLGFKKPAHDLSRGCSTDDIVRAVTIAVAQAQ